MTSKGFPVLMLISLCTMVGVESLSQRFSQEEFRFRHYSRKDGLLNDFADRLKQDSLGFIWIQYYGGLSRFDGYSFKTYKYDPEDPQTSGLTIPLGFILKDPTNEISIAERRPSGPGAKRTLVRLNRKTDSFLKYEINLPDIPIYQWLYETDGSALWIATHERGLYRYHFQNAQLENHQNLLTDGKQLAPLVSVTVMRHYGAFLLIGIEGRGLWLFDKKTNRFRRPDFNPRDTALLHNSTITAIVDNPDKNDRHLWIATGETFVRLDSTFSIVQALRVPTGIIPANVAYDQTGVFWYPSPFGSNDGLYRYDTKDSTLVKLKNDPSNPRSLASNMVYDVIVDVDQNIWVGTDRGVSVLQRRGLKVHNTKVEGGTVWSALVYKTRTAEYLLFSKSPSKTKQVEMAKIDEKDDGALHFKPFLKPVDQPILKMRQAKRRLWVVAFGGGILGYPIDEQSGMPASDSPIILKHDPNNTNTISSDVVVDVWEDEHANLWVSNMIHGMDRVRLDVPYREKGSVFRYGAALSGAGLLWEDNKSFWIRSDRGIELVRVSDDPSQKGNVETLIKSIPTPRVIFKASDGVLFLGTYTGLYVARKENSREYTLAKTPWIESAEIASIKEDRSGRLWVHADNAIVCIDRKDSTATTFNESDGLDHLSGIEESEWLQETRNGSLIVSGLNGFSFIDPSSFEISDRRTLPLLTKLDVNNVAVSGVSLPGDASFSTASDITGLKTLRLDHLHNNFAVEFSAMEMTAPEKNRYRHKLEGYDQQWIETDATNRKATYTNLDAGNYAFKVMASNHHGIWSDQEIVLVVRILPPPWKTWWAYSLYGIALIAAFLYWRRYENRRLKLKHRAQHLTELDRLKTRFFANISHEFRTPITLILGPLKDLHDKTTDADQKSVLSVVLRNGQRLLRLINQLLDLSKLEAGKMQLHTTATELVNLLRNITAAYETLARERNIKYYFEPEINRLVVSIDEDKIERVVHNLLSNAFKFTKENGEITVRLRVFGKHAIISVDDTGIGIPPDQLDKVFDRFYQVDNSLTRVHEGSGLGMALSKELIELHGGHIDIESSPGKGTRFRVWLPLPEERLIGEGTTSVQGRERKYENADLPAPASPEVYLEGLTAGDTRPLLLIVEDNRDMRLYLRRTLSLDYQTDEAENGKEGLRKAQETIPDLIISDIMMPEMDGYQLCHEIKSKEATSHIPVVLLTAKADRESKLAGLETRADDYLSKPLDSDELRLIVRNRIEERRMLRERFSREITLEPTQLAITSLDEKFITKVMYIVEKHLEDESYSIEQFAEDAGYSHVQFYRKIKTMTGQTPSVFFRTIRLKRAAQLLSKRSDNVTQIAYSVGFSSVSYFNKCFKEQFGSTPRQFAEENFKV